MRDYLLIKQDIIVNGQLYPELITAVLSRKGFKRIGNLNDFLQGKEEVVLETEELFKDGATIYKIARSGFEVYLKR